MAKASLVVEMDAQEVRNAIAEKARESIKGTNGVGGVRVELLERDSDNYTARVTFTWAN